MRKLPNFQNAAQRANLRSDNQTTIIAYYDFEISISYICYFDKKKIAADYISHARRSQLQEKFERIDIDIKDVLKKKIIFANEYHYDSYTIYIKSRAKRAARKLVIVDDLNTDTVVKIKIIIIELWR